MNRDPDGFTVESQPVEGRDGVVLVRVRGEIDFNRSPELHEALLEVLEQKPRRVVIDLSNVAYIDSSGVGTLVDAQRRLKRDGGRVVLAGLQDRVRGVLEISGLDQFFTIAASVQEALEA